MWQRDDKKNEDKRSRTCTTMALLLVKKLQPKISFQIFHHRNQQYRKCTHTNTQ